ncbi:MAG: metallophosphoesterase family protein [Actinomycetota bacterium]
MRRLVTFLVVLGVVATACAERPARDVRQAGSGPVVAAVGDIACNSLPSEHTRRCRYDLVAEAIRALSPDAFLVLGDVQYLHGAYDDLLAYYDRFFGDLKPITHPAIGNHETYTLYGQGYYDYFGDAAHPPGGWYSFDLGTWHLVALNSQLCKGSTWTPELGQRAPITKSPAIDRGCGPGTPEYEWLKRDLLTHPAACTLAYLHHPLYGSEPYPQGVFLYQLQPLYELLDVQGVDVVLAGHEHNYQRFAPMDAFGRADANGFRQFVVGTGGSTYGELPDGDVAANREAGQDRSFGVLRLQLGAGGYDWAFVTAPGEEPFEDSGHADCG